MEKEWQNNEDKQLTQAVGSKCPDWLVESSLGEN